MSLVQFDKYTTSLLERIAFGIEEQNQRLENIEKKIDTMSEKIETTSSNMECIEMMMENSENI